MEKSYNYDGAIGSAASLGLKGQDSSESSEDEDASNDKFDDELMLEQ